MKFRGGMGELMRQASRLQRKIDKRKEELKTSTYEGTAADGKVTVSVNGANEILAVKLDPTLLTAESVDMVQDLIVVATNAALANARDTVEKEIEKVTGGLKIPGLT
jgi:nucleoid-associated protein EbfC